MADWRSPYLITAKETYEKALSLVTCERDLPNRRIRYVGLVTNAIARPLWLRDDL